MTKRCLNDVKVAAYDNLAPIIAALQVCRKNRAETYKLLLMLVRGETAVFYDKLLEVANDAEQAADAVAAYNTLGWLTHRLISGDLGRS